MISIRFILAVLVFLTTILSVQKVQAQGDSHVLQFSGLVVAGDSSYGIPGVYLYVSKAGRGTMTNYYGFFSMPVVDGDTVVISAVGFRKREHIVRYDGKQNLSVVIELPEDTVILPVVEVYPYHTVELFKQAFLALNADDPRMANIEASINHNLLVKMYYNSTMDARLNSRNYINQQTSQQYNIPTNNFLQVFNPHAWKKTIKTMKNEED